MAVRKATTTETHSSKTPAKKSAPRNAPAGAPPKAATAKRTPAHGDGAKKSPTLRREDLGAPVEHFFARHPPEQRAQLEALHAMAMKVAPGVRASIKWGMPYYELKRGFCSLYTASSYVGLNIMAPPEKLDDPEGKLEGTGKTMRHLKVRSAADLDEARILRWLDIAIAHQA